MLAIYYDGVVNNDYWCDRGYKFTSHETCYQLSSVVGSIIGTICDDKGSYPWKDRDRRLIYPSLYAVVIVDSDDNYTHRDVIF